MKRSRFERVETLTILVMLCHEAGNAALVNFILLNLLKVKSIRLYIVLMAAVVIFRMMIAKDSTPTDWEAYEFRARWIDTNVVEPLIGKIEKVRNK